MNLRSKISTIVLIAALLVIVFIPLIEAQDQPAFVIGVLDNAEGSIGRGAQLAADRFNRFGGVRGADGTLFRLDLLVEPFDPATLADTVTRFSESNVIAVIGPEDGTALVENLPVLEALQVPIFTPANSDPLLSQDTTGLVYRSRARAMEQARALAGYLTRDLGYANIATVQLDTEPETQVNLLSFVNALPVQPIASVAVEDPTQFEARVSEVVPLAPDAIVAYGDPAQAGALLNALRTAGFTGFFGYNRADDPAFEQAVPPAQRGGVLGATSWSVANDDDESNAFVLNYVQSFEMVPDEIAVASYDAVQFIATAIRQGGEFAEILAGLNSVEGVQGLLRAPELEPRELSNNTAVYTFDALGGEEVVARFAGDQRLPDVVYLTVTSEVQNVRSGPSTDFEVLGQIEQGERVPIAGTNADQTWVVIDFGGQQGWMATYLLDIRGNLSSLPLVEEPVLTTPVEPTAAVEQQPEQPASTEADIVVDSAVVTPFPIIPNEPFDIAVTLRNAGMTDAGEFAIAATLAPDGLYTSTIIPGLAAGQSTTTNLTGTLTSTGAFTVEIIADLNNQVAESQTGESNNAFPFNYLVNKNIIRQDTRILNPGDVFDLEGDTVQDENQRLDDIQWDGNGINTLPNATVEIINPGQDGFDWANTGVDENNGIYWNLTNPDVVNRIHYSLLDPTVVDEPNIAPENLQPGALVGVITADGKRGLLRIDEMPENNQMEVTFLVYQE